MAPRQPAQPPCNLRGRQTAYTATRQPARPPDSLHGHQTACTAASHPAAPGLQEFFHVFLDVPGSAPFGKRRVRDVKVAVAEGPHGRVV
eukprot:39347-Chlamydomonas_euryale.AAC.1